MAYYGPDDSRASKVAVGIVSSEGAQPSMFRFFSEAGDVRHDAEIERTVLDLCLEHGVRTVVATSSLIGCPHEEGIDYPRGAVCPQCPFWAGRDRWAGV